MTVYCTSSRRGGKWSYQLMWLSDLWKKGEETMTISSGISIISNKKKLTQDSKDGVYAFAKFVNQQTTERMKRASETEAD